MRLIVSLKKIIRASVAIITLSPIIQHLHIFHQYLLIQHSILSKIKSLRLKTP